jgi:hypothetical protein
LNFKVGHFMRFRSVVWLVVLGWLCCTSASRPAPQPMIWQDPGDVEKLDLGGSLGFPVAQPRPPFRFVKEDTSGTQPKVFLTDASGAKWNVKFGDEVKPESFGWRIVKASGYFAEPNFFVGQGRIEMLQPMTRHSEWLKADGTFRNARFQWRTEDMRYLDNQAWSWDRNPYLHSKELNGLKILLMLVSNYDNKDSRVGEKGGPNTATFELKGGQRWYAFTDWGAGLGRWGDRAGQTNWRCGDFTAQSKLFVTGVDAGRVKFGFEGHIAGFTAGITPGDVAWLMRYAGRITDAQLRAGLRASGATPEEEQCFARALRTRIDALRAVAH